MLFKYVIVMSSGVTYELGEFGMIKSYKNTSMSGFYILHSNIIIPPPFVRCNNIAFALLVYFLCSCLVATMLTLTFADATLRLLISFDNPSIIFFIESSYLENT